MIFAGENLGSQLTLIEQRLRAARNNALSFVNTPDFKELYEVWWNNRRAQYHNYYNMFLSYAPANPQVSGPAVINSNGTSATTTGYN